MHNFSKPLIELIDALQCLPGVGPKTAQRMSFYLLQGDRQSGKRLSAQLNEAITQLQHCERCQSYTENALCDLCEDPKRDHNTLCIVESPQDVMALEQTHSYRGAYFVLLGHLSPLDGIGPQELGLHKLEYRFQTQTFQEIILATNSTIEGEATAHYLAEMIKPYKIRTSRIAHGVPMGGELEYIDAGTLSRALQSREPWRDHNETELV